MFINLYSCPNMSNWGKFFEFQLASESSQVLCPGSKGSVKGPRAHSGDQVLNLVPKCFQRAFLCPLSPYLVLLEAQLGTIYPCSISFMKKKIACYIPKRQPLYDMIWGQFDQRKIALKFMQSHEPLGPNRYELNISNEVLNIHFGQGAAEL